jgi:CRT-like, chloroquine-resistance transporter-like
MLRQVLDDAAAQQQHQEQQRYYQNENSGLPVDQSGLLQQPRNTQSTDRNVDTIQNDLRMTGNNNCLHSVLVDSSVVEESSLAKVNDDISSSIAQKESDNVAESTANLSRQLQQRQKHPQNQKLLNNGRGYGSMASTFNARMLSTPPVEGTNGSFLNNNTVTPKKSILKTSSKMNLQQQERNPATVGTLLSSTEIVADGMIVTNPPPALNDNGKSHRRALTTNDAYHVPTRYDDSNNNINEYNDYSDDDDDDDDDDEEEEEDGIVTSRPLPWWEKILNSAVSLFLVVADVENLWDSPERNDTSVPIISPSNSLRKNRTQQTRLLPKGSTTTNNKTNRSKVETTAGGVFNSNHSRSTSSMETSNHPYDAASIVDDADDNAEDDEWIRWYKANRRRNNTIVLFWFVVLAASYATERSTFKLLVDNVEPFRLISAQYVTLMHAILLCIGIALERWYTSSTVLSASTSNHTSPTLSTSAGSLAASPQQQQQQSQIYNTSRQQFNRRGRRQQHEHNIQDHQFAMWKLPLGIPYVSVGVMALLDSISLLSLFLSGSHVPPLCTVILIQFTIPLTAFLTQFIHSDGRFHCVVKWISQQCTSEDTDDDEEEGDENNNNQHIDSNEGMNHPPPPPQSGAVQSPNQRADGVHQNDPQDTSTALPGYGGLAIEHVWGSVVLALAVLIALIPALYSLVNPKYFAYADTIPIRTAVNTLVYVTSCIPAAASQLYKEHVFLQHRQPVNINYLNLLLSVLQVVIAIVVSPVLFTLQGLSSTIVDDWTTLYPSNQYRENYIDSLRCLFNVLSDDDQLAKYAEDAQCDYAFLLVLLQAFSTITVGVAVDKIVNAGATKVMYRGISAGIIGAAICMKLYDSTISEYNYGPIITTVNFVCLVLLILGSEIYHRVSLQESTYETIYPEIHIQNYETL